MYSSGRSGIGEYRGAKTVLLVDDDLTYCAAIRDILDHEGLRTVVATSTQEALLILAETTPDLILSDTMISAAEGDSLLRILRGVDRLRDIPVVTVSGRAMSLDKAEAFAAGTNDFLAKPFTASDLLAVVRGQLAGRGQRAA